MRGKIDFRRLTPKELQSLETILWATVGAAKNTDSCIVFLKGLLTPSEQVMLARRIQIAKLLLQGATHLSIRQTLGVGWSTIDSVDRWLRGVYETYRLDGSRRNRGGKRPYPQLGSFEYLRKKYPAHFLFFNLLLNQSEEIND
ncbi:hypothetical protein HZA45_03200 [Candidatus Peregrinibacteria bacterium]|nr:hypothetical protein [Candidatus Peregrinibacteria bacterium]